MKEIDIVVPFFNEEGIVKELVSRLQSVTKHLNYKFKFIMIDDGSKDATLSNLLSFQNIEPRLEVVKLSRNWGHQNAYNAGLDRSSGDALILMDGDLEDPPEVIPEMIKKWEEGYNVVYSVKRSRQRNFFYRFIFNSFYKVYQFFSDVAVDHSAGMFSLIDKKVVTKIRSFKEKNRYYVGLRFFVGFNQVKIIYDRGKRFTGKPKQSFRKLLNYGLNAIFSFSFLPIRSVTYFGFFILLFISLCSALLVLSYFTDSGFWFFARLKDVPGWTSIVLLLFFVLGTQTIFIGILGEYIARIFDEVRNRPYYIIDEVYESNDKEK
jgi:polyisoprenyl-phosphate glycosyltransferase